MVCGSAEMVAGYSGSAEVCCAERGEAGPFCGVRISWTGVPDAFWVRDIFVSVPANSAASTLAGASGHRCRRRALRGPPR